MAGATSDDVLTAKQRFMLDRTSEFLTLINRSYTYDIVNSSYCAAMERTMEEVVGSSVAEIWGEERFASVIKPQLDRCFGGEEVSSIDKFRFGGEKRYMNVTYRPYPGDGSPVSHVLVTSRDITHLGELEEMLMNFEFRDPVTGMFNRKSLEVLLEVELIKAQRFSTTELRALLFIGIENLAEISRVHGYDIGDHILENTGIRVKQIIRDCDHLFRFQGNELAVILSHLAEERDAEKVATKIVELISLPYRFRGTDIVLTCRAGAAIYPSDGPTTEALMRNAAAALADAARDDKPFRRYNSGSLRRANRRLNVETELRRALEREQFELYLQPIVRSSGGIEGAEALIRWNRPRAGIVLPHDFLPIAVEIGMMEAISRWTIFAAVRQIAKICARYSIYLSINLTGRAFESADLTATLSAALQQTNGRVAPSNVKLEIADADAAQRSEATNSRITSLLEEGFEVYIDDFGTGRSSLFELQNLSARTLKIDRSFVEALSPKGGDEPFVKHVVELLKSRGKRLIAKGVTSIEQVETLRRMGCDSFQGFYFAEPLAFDAFESFLERSFAPKPSNGNGASRRRWGYQAQ